MLLAVLSGSSKSKVMSRAGLVNGLTSGASRYSFSSAAALAAREELFELPRLWRPLLNILRRSYAYSMRARMLLLIMPSTVPTGTRFPGSQWIDGLGSHVAATVVITQQSHTARIRPSETSPPMYRAVCTRCRGCMAVCRRAVLGSKYPSLPSSCQMARLFDARPIQVTPQLQLSYMYPLRRISRHARLCSVIFSASVLLSRTI